MTKILNIAEAVLYVEKLEPAMAFYVKVLGLPTTAVFEGACFLQTGPNSTLILIEIDALERRVSIIPAHGTRGQGHVAFAILPEEMDSWRVRLLTHDIEIEHEQDWPLGTHSIYFRDPDQNSIELIDATHYVQKWAQLEQPR